MGWIGSVIFHAICVVAWWIHGPVAVAYVTSFLGHLRHARQDGKLEIAEETPQEEVTGVSTEID